MALLRGINLGRRNVKNDQLREIFEGLGFADVETFIASGNIVFTSQETNGPALSQSIGAGLREALGYEVLTLVRTGREMVAVAEHEPFPELHPDEAAAINIAFLSETVEGDLRERVLALATEVDAFHVHGREIYWRFRGRMSESVAWAPFEKLMTGRGTVRNANTVRRIAQKFFSSPADA